MVSIPTGLAIATSTPGDRTVPSSFRRIMAVLFQQSAAGTPVAGIVPAPGTPLDVELTAAMEYTVKAGYAVTTRANQGAYLVGTPIDVTVPTDTGHVTYDRWDRLYIVQPDPELSDVGVARIDVAKGTPSGSPALPALPTGALELGRVLVPSGAATTNDATGGVTNKAARTKLNVDAVAYGDLTGVPSTFPPSAHDINGSAHTGTLSVAKGGTGSTTASAARTALGAASTDASSLVTGTLDSARLPSIPLANLPTITVAKGGTGGTTVTTAREGLRIFVNNTPGTPQANDIRMLDA